MEQKTIKSCISALAINKTLINRHFSFQVFRESNKRHIIAEISLNCIYAYQMDILPNINDDCSIYINNNDSEQELIFQGSIIKANPKDNYIHILAEYIGIDDNIFEETYLNCDTKTIISQFIPNIQYEASNPNNNRLILKEAKYSNLLRLLHLHNMNFFIDKKHQVVIMNGYNKRKYNIYNITKCIRYKDSSTITIFPIPDLEIGDIVYYDPDQKFYVTSITYDFSSKMKMKLGVQYVNNNK